MSADELPPPNNPRMDLIRQKAVNVYVDGFNFYYGVLDGEYSQYKWINIHKFIRRLLISQKDLSLSADINNALIRIKYFTAEFETLHLPLCGGKYHRKRKEDFERNKRYEKEQLDKVNHQKNYLAMLGDEPNTLIEKGFHAIRFNEKKTLPEVKKINGKLCVTGQRFQTREIEEKGSDVNLAVRLVADSYDNTYGEWAIVVSDDADLESAIRTVRKSCQKKVLLLNPSRHRRKKRSSLGWVANRSIRLHDLKNLESLLKQSQFPAEKRVRNKQGRVSIIRNPYL